MGLDTAKDEFEFQENARAVKPRYTWSSFVRAWVLQTDIPFGSQRMVSPPKGFPLVISPTKTACAEQSQFSGAKSHEQVLA